MSESEQPGVGTVVWTDLTVENAEAVRDFYIGVVGWRAEPVDMGEYSDFNMVDPETGEPKCGVCHARGTNAELPPQWIHYVVVADLDASLARCRELGGDTIGSVREMTGQGRYCVVRDPAGAVTGLWEFAAGAETP